MKKALMIGICGIVLLVGIGGHSSFSYAQTEKYYVWGKTADCRNKNVCIDIETNKPITGIVKDYHSNGQLYSEGNYKDGKRDGLEKRYYENGQLWEERNWKDDEEYVKGYDENGRLTSEGNVKKGTEEGVWKYYENGQLKKVIEIKMERWMD